MILNLTLSLYALLWHNKLALTYQKKPSPMRYFTSSLMPSSQAPLLLLNKPLAESPVESYRHLIHGNNGSMENGSNLTSSTTLTCSAHPQRFLQMVSSCAHIGNIVSNEMVLATQDNAVMAPNELPHYYMPLPVHTHHVLNNQFNASSSDSQPPSITNYIVVMLKTRMPTCHTLGIL